MENCLQVSGMRNQFWAACASQGMERADNEEKSWSFVVSTCVLRAEGFRTPSLGSHLCPGAMHLSTPPFALGQVLERKEDVRRIWSVLLQGCRQGPEGRGTGRDVLFGMMCSTPPAAGACHREELPDVTHTTLKTKGDGDDP